MVFKKILVFAHIDQNLKIKQNVNRIGGQRSVVRIAFGNSPQQKWDFVFTVCQPMIDKLAVVKSCRAVGTIVLRVSTSGPEKFT